MPSPIPSVGLPNAYENEWRRFRAWNYLAAFALFLFAGVPVLAAIVSPATQQFFSKPNAWAVAYIAFAAFAVVGCGIRQQLLRCPHCKDYFFLETLTSMWPIHNENFRARRCVHCGLKLYGHAE